MQLSEPPYYPVGDLPHETPKVNTDLHLFAEDETDAYSPRCAMTADRRLDIGVGGYHLVLSLADWHRAAGGGSYAGVMSAGEDITTMAPAFGMAAAYRRLDLLRLLTPDERADQSLIERLDAWLVAE